MRRERHDGDPTEVIGVEGGNPLFFGLSSTVMGEIVINYESVYDQFNPIPCAEAMKQCGGKEQKVVSKK